MPAAARHLRRSPPRHTSGLDGRGGSSYIDKVMFRDRDKNSMATGGDSTREERFYYLQNWRNDVVALITPAGVIVERYRYDAYGKPESYTPADLTGNAGGPDGVIAAADFTKFNAVWSIGGPVTWQTDISDTAGTGAPDGATDNGDSVAYTSYYFAGTTGGIGLISGIDTDNRKGLAGYEFDPILAGNGAPKGSAVPLYHVRNRVLNCYSGKWMQKDPLGYHDSMDLYEYCQSDPADNSDSQGLACDGGCPIAGAAPPRRRTVPQPEGTPPVLGPDGSGEWPDKKKTEWCCKQQDFRGKGSVADTFCCFGRPVICQRNKAALTAPKDVSGWINDCVMEHERVHYAQFEPICRKKCLNGVCNPYNSSTDPDLLCNECAAYGQEMTCLLRVLANQCANTTTMTPGQRASCRLAVIIRMQTVLSLYYIKCSACATGRPAVPTEQPTWTIPGPEQDVNPYPSNWPRPDGVPATPLPHPTIPTIPNVNPDHIGLLP